VISSINYEERTLKWLTSLPNDTIQAVFKILVLRSLYNQVGLLENIKNTQIELAKKKFDSINVSYDLIGIHYPSGFDREVIKQVIRSLCQEVCSGPESNIILDITGLPRAIIFCILRAIYELQKQKTLSPHLYIIYTTALQYPRVEYPHEVGTLVTYFSNKYLYEFLQNGDNLNLLLIPSIYGFETRLLLEGLKKIDFGVVDFHFLVPFYKHDILTGVTVLRMNPGILPYIRSTYGAQLHFPFSLQNAMEMVLDLSDWEVSDSKCLIAPFNIKPLAVSAFYACMHLLEKGMKHADLLRMSTVQYSSLYSIGAGETNCFKVNIT
jgi:hypothetical protein